MAAPLGFKTFTTGEVLTAGDTNGYLMQGIWVFASAAARDAAVTSPQEGNFAYLKDTNVTTYYTGSAWTNLDTTGMVNPMTTTGDTIYSSSGSTPARLGIGSTGQVLTVAGGVPTWATAGGGSMTLLSTTNLSGTTTSVSSISQSYQTLMIYLIAPKWDTGNAQLWFKQNGNNFAAVAAQYYNDGANTLVNAQSGAQYSITASSSSNTDGKVVAVWTIYNYTNTSVYKPFTMTAGTDAQATLYGGIIRNTGAISQIDVTNNLSYSFNSGLIKVYGVN